MKYILILTMLLGLSLGTFGQTPNPKPPPFDMADFNKRVEVAEWLVRYDRVAWKTSDVVMTESKEELAKLGGEWFCYQDSQKLWHAYYGKLVGDNFEAVFHYTYDSAGKITRTKENGDPKLLNAYAKALNLAKARLEDKVGDGTPRFNQYIRRNSDETLDVWLLPAFQQDGTAVYGGEAYYSIDKTATKIVKEETYFQPNFRGFKTSPPREIWLNFRELAKPPLSAIFFVIYYKQYFTKIFIDNEKTVSSLIKTEKDGDIWVHVEKGEAKSSKPEK